jgi:type II secretory pathway component PulK
MPSASRTSNREPDRFAQRQRSSRRGAALLVCIFVVAITTVLVVSMLDGQMLQMTAMRNTLEYERALYLAGAAVHHALALMQESEDPFEAFSIGPIEFPAGSGNTYEADAVDVAGEVVITGSGTSGATSRYLRVTVAQD